MVAGEAEGAELEAVRFEFAKRCSARVDMRLLEKAIVSTFCHEHHRDPIVARVARCATDRFKALAMYVCHVFSSIAFRSAVPAAHGYVFLLRILSS